MNKDYYVLADGSKYYYKRFQNKNAILLGPSGSGKSTLGVIMNMINMPSDNSCIVIDVKGQLYKEYKDYMEDRGFVVKNLSFINPEKSTNFYNPLYYINKTQDIVGLSTILMEDMTKTCKDIFWPSMGIAIFNSVIGYVYETEKKTSKKCNLHYVGDLMRKGIAKKEYRSYSSELDNILNDYERENEDSWAVSQYKTFKACMAAESTYASALTSALVVLNTIESKEINHLMSKDDIDIKSIGKIPTCLFVEVSDTDRSLDSLVNLFISQCMQELCRLADSNKDGSLKVKTNFFIDDAGSAVKINGLENYISNIRSRNITCTLAIQSLGQLSKAYGDGKSTIMDSSDILEVFGCNDVDTASEISIRLNKSRQAILQMKPGTCFVNIRGEEVSYIEDLKLSNIKIHKRVYKEDRQLVRYN